MPAGSSSEETPQNCQKKIVKVLFLDSNFISTDNRTTISHMEPFNGQYNRFISIIRSFSF